MSRNFKSIEFFGIPGCGKTYCASIIRQILKKKGNNVFNARECIVNGSGKLIKLNIIEKIVLNYFKLLNFKNENLFKNFSKKNNKINIKSNINYNVNYFKIEYQKICKKIIFQKKKFHKIIKEIEKIFKDKNNLKNQQYLFWIYELFASQIIYENYYKKKNRNLLLLDEGLIQRSFTINNKISDKNKNKFFEYYFSKVPISNSIFLISASKKKIKHENIRRKLKNISKYKKNNELLKFETFLNSYLIKQNKFKFKEIKNNMKLKKNLYRIFKI